MFGMGFLLFTNFKTLKLILNRAIIANWVHFARICSYYASQAQVDAQVIYEALDVRSYQG